MAGLVRMSRPWLHSGLQAPALVAAVSKRGISTTDVRQWRQGEVPREKISNNTWSKAHTLKSQQTKSIQDMTMLLPMTLVTPPLSRFPREPKKFFGMIWAVISNRVTTITSTVGMKVASMEGWTSRPKFKARRRAVVPTAKALHARMSEAFAAGDRDTLRQICLPAMFRNLGAAIDARPRGRAYGWELVEYQRTLTHPRIADWRMGMMPLPDGVMVLKQAVVTIASRQRITQRDAKTGELIPGTERVRDLVEHVVLQARLDNATYESAEWKIWGKLDETTYERYIEDMQLTNDMV